MRPHQPQPSLSLREKLREATASAIIEAAEQVAAEQGVGGASIQAIAERAGTAVGTIYNHFNDKEGLFASLLARRREELYAAIDASARKHAGEPFEKQLGGFVGAVLEYFDARRTFLRIVLEAESPQIVRGDDGRKQPAMQQLRERAARVVRIGMREKRLREDAGDLPATVLVAILKAVLLLRVLEESPLKPETDRVVSLFLHGMSK